MYISLEIYQKLNKNLNLSVDSLYLNILHEYAKIVRMFWRSLPEVRFIHLFPLRQLFEEIYVAILPFYQSNRWFGVSEPLVASPFVKSQADHTLLPSWRLVSRAEFYLRPTEIYCSVRQDMGTFGSDLRVRLRKLLKSSPQHLPPSPPLPTTRACGLTRSVRPLGHGS